jgi:hypothetical protein
VRRAYSAAIRLEQGYKKSPFGLFLLQIKIVFRNLTLQTTLFEHVVNQAALGEVGLTDRNVSGGLNITFGFYEIVIKFDIAFIGSHEKTPSMRWSGSIIGIAPLQSPFGAPYNDKVATRKKDFFNRLT